VAIRPDDPWIRYCLGIAYLTAADFRRGWEGFEARLDRKPLWRDLNTKMGKRSWQGTPSDPPGKSILLVSEQGLGDVIHFIRYVRLLQDDGARVSCVVQPELVALLEGMPGPLAASVTASLTIPTIGIGAGPGCDGQVLVFHDILGLNRDPLPKFVKVFAPLGDEAVAATRAYAAEVAAGTFPDDAHTYS